MQHLANLERSCEIPLPGPVPSIQPSPPSVPPPAPAPCPCTILKRFATSFPALRCFFLMRFFARPRSLSPSSSIRCGVLDSMPFGSSAASRK